VILIIHQDGVSFNKKGFNHSVLMTTIEILTKNHSFIFLNQMQQGHNNININNMILTKEIELLQKGIIFKDKDKNYVLFGDILMIKGDIPQIHETLNIKSFNVCCSKCTGVPNEITILKKKIPKIKKNWDIEKSEQRTVPNTIKNFFKPDQDKHNVIGISPLVFLYKGNFDYFLNSIGSDELHNKFFLKLKLFFLKLKFKKKWHFFENNFKFAKKNIKRNRHFY
jgi:hypothetical protein